MATLLYLEASPRGEQSFSSRAAASFLRGYRERNGEDVIQHVSLFDAALPEFDAEAARQKMEHIAALMAGKRGIEPIGKWAAVVAEVERLKAADKLLIATPMWNYSIPYRLKHWIDVVVQPGLTFYVNRRKEYVGMVRGKPLQLILASGSAYRGGFPRLDDGTKTDFQRAYLEHVFRYIGFEDVRVIKIEPTADATAEEVERMFADQLAEAARAGALF